MMKINAISACPSWSLKIASPSYKSFKYLKSLTFPWTSSSLAKITLIFFHLYEPVSSNSDQLRFFSSELLPSSPNSSWILAPQTDAVCTLRPTANKADGFKLYISQTTLPFKHPNKICLFCKQHDTDSCSTCDPVHPQVLFLVPNQLFLTLHSHSW